jgi:hypothetical protein
MVFSRAKHCRKSSALNSRISHLENPVNASSLSLDALFRDITSVVNFKSPFRLDSVSFHSVPGDLRPIRFTPST